MNVSSYAVHGILASIMDTLSMFLDSQKDTAHLFKGLYIESSPAFAQINKHPVVYLDFVNIDSSNLIGVQRSFRRQVLGLIEYLLDTSKLSLIFENYIKNPSDYSSDIVGELLKAIAERYGMEPFLIIDEYDKVIMDTLSHPEGSEIKNFIVVALQSALKGQTYFKKAVLTGVTRTTKENLFSGLNNLKTYDIFTPSVYDADFSLTENEMLELVGESEIDGVRKWYNNMRVGDALLYNIYSVMNYLSDPKAGLKDCQLNMEHIKDTKKCSDVSFYTLAVQAGYLTFAPLEFGGYKVFIPNMEARQVWSRLILDKQYRGIDENF